MNENSTLYWSALSKYEECPQEFLWSYGWDTIDLGRGLGKGKKTPEIKSKHHAIMGTVTQYAVEKLYNDELYRDPKNLSKRLSDLIENEWARQESKPYNPIDYTEARMSREELIQTCKDGALGYLKTMKAHRLLGPYAKAEVPLLGWINKWTAIGGRADIILRREDTGVTILDGKNTKHKMKYTDPDQVRWYALVFKLAYRELPSRLGFIWYRFPYGMEGVAEDGEPFVEQGVEWVPFTEEDLKGLAHRAVDARNGMRKEKFEATPKPPVCNFCDFESVCPARQAQRQENSSKRTSNQNTLEEFETGRRGGFIDLLP